MKTPGSVRVEWVPNNIVVELNRGTKTGIGDGVPIKSFVVSHNSKEEKYTWYSTMERRF